MDQPAIFSTAKILFCILHCTPPACCITCCLLPLAGAWQAHGLIQCGKWTATAPGLSWKVCNVSALDLFPVGWVYQFPDIYLPSPEKCHKVPVSDSFYSSSPYSLTVKDLKRILKNYWNKILRPEKMVFTFQTDSVKKTPFENPWVLWFLMIKIPTSCSSCSWKWFCKENVLPKCELSAKMRKLSLSLGYSYNVFSCMTETAADVAAIV